MTRVNAQIWIEVLPNVDYDRFVRLKTVADSHSVTKIWSVSKIILRNTYYTVYVNVFDKG